MDRKSDLVGGLSHDLDSDACRVGNAFGGVGGISEGQFDEGNLRREAFNSGTAPSRSWIEAGWTCSTSGLPSVSTIACRLRPSTFLDHSYPRSLSVRRLISP